jgi:integrase-like protein
LHAASTAVLKAHDVKPQWLSEESQEAFRQINLRWHDLRHEYASRLVEEGVPLAQVRDLLGHASITTTERYDNQTLENLQIAVTKLERVGCSRPAPRRRQKPRRHKRPTSCRGASHAQSFKILSRSRVRTPDRMPSRASLQSSLTS